MAFRNAITDLYYQGAVTHEMRYCFRITLIACYKPFSCNQQLPFTVSDSCCYCSLEVVSSNPKPIASQRVLSYLMMSPQDYTLSRITARVKITVDTSHSRPPNELSIPPIDELNPPSITLNPKFFG